MLPDYELRCKASTTSAVLENVENKWEHSTISGLSRSMSAPSRNKIYNQPNQERAWDKSILHQAPSLSASTSSAHPLHPTEDHLSTMLSPRTIAELRTLLSSKTSIVPSVSYDTARGTYLYKNEQIRVEKLEKEREQRVLRKSVDTPKTARVAQGIKNPREAAVLIPLISVLKRSGQSSSLSPSLPPSPSASSFSQSKSPETELGILMQVRAGGMRMHAGEVG